MEVTYELLPEDIWQYSTYVRHKRAVLRPLFLYALIGMLILVFLGTAMVEVEAWTRLHLVHWSLLLSVAVTSFLVFLLLPPTKKRLTKAFSQQPGVFGEHRVSISPDGFSNRTLVIESKTAWDGFQSVEENHSHIFLFVSKNNAHVVPKRAFSSPAEANAFLGLARRYLDAAKTRTPITAEDAAVWPPAPRPGASHQ